MKHFIPCFLMFLMLGNLSAKKIKNLNFDPAITLNNPCLTNPCVTVICPQDITIDCIENFTPLAVDATAMSVCGTITSQWVTQPDQTGGPNCPLTTYVYTYKAVDDQGNIGCCERTVTILNTDPTITVPPGFNVECFDEILVQETDATVTTSCGEELEVTIYPPVINGVFDCPGTTYTWTYRVEDQCEREATVDRIFTNGDNDPPGIIAPDDTTCECFAGINANPNNATVSTACSLGANTETIYLGASGNMDCPGTMYTYLYKVTDDCGRMATDLQVYTIDNGPPVFDNCPENCLTLDCEEDYEIFIQAWLSMVTAHTSCGLPLEVTNDYDPANQGVCFDDGTVVVNFYATDQCGRTSVCQGMILVLDLQAPVFSALPAGLIVECDGTVIFDDVIATDNCTDVVLTYEDEIVMDVCLGGEATRSWTATDECGNTATTMQIVTVLPDTEAPEFTFVPADYTIDCNGMLVFGDATAVDDCSNVMLTFEDLTNSDPCNGGSATRTWTAEDDCGNTAQAVQTITVLPDTEAPMFTQIPDDLTIDCDDAMVFGDALASDDCGNVTLTMTDATAGYICNGQTATRTWTAEDDCGNTAQAVQTITILPDTEAPMFTQIPDDLTIDCDDAVVFGDALASDDCGNVMLSMVDATTGDICNGQTATRTWTAEDDCGNTAQAIQTITILPDTEAPMFTQIPDDLTIDCNDAGIFGDATASDDCGNVTLSMVDATTGDICNGQTATRTWTAEDDCGNTAQAVQTITVLPDTEAPMFTQIPDDLTIDCDDAIVFGDAMASDDCGNVTLTMTDATSGDICNGQTATRTWTAEDDCGNMAQAVQTITILPDTEAPMFTQIPDDLTIDCDDMVVFGDAMASDDCGNVTLSMVDATTGDICNGQTATRTWTAEDDCGNTAQAVQTITILPDTEAPMFTQIPDDLTINCDDAVIFGDATASDDCGNVTLSMVDATTGDICNGQTATRTWTAEDDCGNTAQAVQTITILPDTEAPMFTQIPDDLTINCDDAVIFGDATASDDCGNVTLSMVDATTGDICNGQTATRTWTAEDDCGNTAQAVQTITILPDTEAPMFTQIPDDLTIDCNDAVIFGDATASDDCGNVTLSMVDATTGDICNGQTATRTWTAEDDCGNMVQAIQTITILPDTEAPMFTQIPDDLTINCDDAVIFGDATASDDCGNVTLTMMDATTGDICNGQTATRTWTAEDDCGNMAQAVQTITILPDTEAPMFTQIPDDLTIDCDDAVVFGDAQASDDCGNVMLSMVDATTGNICNGQTATRTWTAEDDCGNTAQAVQTITILPDTEAPMFTQIPDDLTIDCDDAVVFGDAQASDDCGNVTLTMVDATTGDICNGQTATRTWTAEDDCGNTAQAVQTITILPDTEAPMFTQIPDDLTIDCDDAVVFGDAQASDDCGNVTLTMMDATTGDICNGQTATRTWTAEDDCGNTAQAVQTITILPDTEAPMFTQIPDDLTIDCNDAVVFGDAMASDDCGNVMLSMVDATTGDICSGQTATRTWTAEDDCGNISVAVQTIITLPDTNPPVFTDHTDDFSVDCNDVIPDISYSVLDSCGITDVLVSIDTIGDFCTGGTITRTWTATDACGNSSMEFHIMTLIPDTEAPVLTCPDTLVRNIQSVGICERLGVLAPVAMDNCTDNLTISYAIDFGNDGSIDTTGVVINPLLFITYPIGTNIVTFSTEDECGHTATCISVVIVKDLVPPGFFCNPVTVTLTILDSMGNVTPGEFIFPPFLECCEDTILFELPDGTFTDSLFFDCDDTQFVNGIDVKVRAFDCFGNSSACDTKVFVVPPDEDPDFCNPEPPPFAFISGHILTEDGNHMDSVYVELTGGMEAESMTSNAGYYEFLSLPTNYDYSIDPYLNIDPLNGVSTLDILLVNQHILAIQSLDSPYKMIAADVNQSGSITVFDVLEIQQLILGTVPEFEDNTSWRFIDADFLFPVNENPFSNAFPEACYIYDLYNGVSSVDFVGIKTGDVNGSAMVNFQDEDSEDRGGGELVFTTPEQQLARNEKLTIPFRAEDFQRVLGFQFSFNFNTENLEFTGIKPGKLATIEERNFGYHFLEDGILTASWHSVSPYSILDGDVLFELEFLVKNDVILSDQVSIGSFFTRAEAYQEGEPILDLLLEFTDEVAKPEEPIEFQNRPNPFKDETIISFHLSREIRGIFTLLDINRQVIRQERGMFPAGYNEFVIHGKELPGYGIYYYQFKTAKHNIWRKMVFIDDL